MREILFRGKQEDNGEWVYGAYYHQTEFYGDDCDYHYIISSCDELEDNMMCFDGVIPETVGQYTGLTDKNGKRIFEGDIIDTPDRLIKVVWFERNAQFDLNFIKHAHDKKIINFKGIEMRDLKEYEVIGNIHDNPELIESEDSK